MRVNGTPYRSIWLNDDSWSVDIIDQTYLPHEFVIRSLKSMEEAAEAISTMRVRGAPLIGAMAAYGVALAMRERADDDSLALTCAHLLETRPTAVNLRWALARLKTTLEPLPAEERCPVAYALARDICAEDVEINNRMGELGLRLIRGLWEQRRYDTDTLHILTHCNAWMRPSRLPTTRTMACPVTCTARRPKKPWPWRGSCGPAWCTSTARTMISGPPSAVTNNPATAANGAPVESRTTWKQRPSWPPERRSIGVVLELLQHPCHLLVIEGHRLPHRQTLMIGLRQLLDFNRQRQGPR